MAEVKKRTLRVKLDTSLAPLSLATWRGNALDLQIGIYDSLGVAAITNVSSVNVKVQASQVDNTTLMDSTVASGSMDATLDDAAWLDGSKQHATFAFSDAEANLSLGGSDVKSFWIVFTALLTSGETLTLGAGWLRMQEDNDTTAGDPAVNPGVAITVDESDARYVRSVTAGITGADKVTNEVSLTQAEYDDVITPDASTVYLITDGGIYLGSTLIANNSASGGGSFFYSSSYRVLASTSNHWVGYSTTWGFNDAAFQSTFGTGVEPDVDRDHMGVPVLAGQTLKAFTLIGNVDVGADFTDFDIRIIHSYGAFDGTWSAGGGNTRDEILSVDGVTLSSVNTAFHQYSVSGLDHAFSDDGFILLYIKPNGSRTSNRYLYATVTMELE